MGLATRRQFVQEAAFAAGALCTFPSGILAQAMPKGGNQPSLDSAAIRKFASAIGGQVIVSGSSEYESSRMVFNRAFDQRPAMIVRPSAAADVARALDFAQRQHLPVAVRGGGHSRAGFGGCDGGVVIDFSRMKRIQVDAEKRTARAEAGSLVRDFDAATRPFNLATTMGGCLTVGIAGLTLGGGEGFLMPKFGAACDNLIAAHVVTVDGRELELSEVSNPDLFWAIRGGGGNFGVATWFEYRLHPVGEALSGTLAYSSHQVSEMLHAFAGFIRGCPDELNVFAEILPSTDGPGLLLHLCSLGEASRGNDLLQPLRTPVKPVEDKVRAMSYSDAQAAGFLPAPFAHFQTNLFLPDLRPAIETIRTAIHEAPAQFRVLIIPFYGCVTRIAPTDTAFALRQFGFEVDMLGSWNTAGEKDGAVRWVKSLRDRLQPFAHGTYVNQLGETNEDLVRAAYGPNYARLAAVKRKYDPENVLSINQNIHPA
jgi:hypothetical protein